MKITKPLIIVAILFAFAPTVDAEEAIVAPPVEVRAVWIDAGAIPKTAQGIRDLLSTYHEASINVLFPEVISRGYAAYESKMLARDPRFAGAPDPLPVMIKEAHALGMEIHPWVWIFRAGYTKDRGAILTAHPDWVELSKDGDELSPNGGLWISPCSKPARDFIASLLAEIVCQYDVDGLHLDYVRYESESSAPYGYSPASVSVFEKQSGIDLMSIEPLTMAQREWNKFRERQINTFVQRIALQTRARKPHVKLSAAVGPDPKIARLDLMQNWPHWLDNKWLDFVVPMSYSTDDRYFASLLDRESTATGNRSLVVAGIGVAMQKDPTQLDRQIGIARTKLAAGQALFSASSIKPDALRALKDGTYDSAARLPYRNTEWVICELRDKAASLACEGNCTSADQLLAMADKLTAYLNYQNTPMGYVPPTDPPFTIPENVVRLPNMILSPATTPPVIDGSLDDAVWQSAARVQLGYTNDGRPATAVTDVYVTTDDTNLYVGFRCAENQPDMIRAQATQRDGNAFYDDSVEVFLKPAKTGRTYYHFAVNTAGYKFDQKNLDPAWNADWQAMSKIAADSWTTEIAIPFAQINRAAPGSDTTWTANFTRNRTTSGSLETFVWAVPYGTLHTPGRFGRLRFE